MSDGRSTSTTRPQPAVRRILLPLALAQFICSFAGSNMNVMINDISNDLTPRAGRAGRHHHLPAGHGRPDDPRGEADRQVRTQTLFPGRAGHLRDRCADERGGTGPGGADHRQLDPRGCGYGPAHPARLHPDDAVVHRPHVPGQGLRCDQCDGRHRRRRGAAHRRPDHDCDQLASGVCVPGIGDRPHRAAGARDPRSAAGRSREIFRHRRRSLVGGWPDPRRHWHPRRRPEPLGDARSRGGRRACPALVLRDGPSQGAERTRAVAVDQPVPQPYVQPRLGHAECAVAPADRHLLRRRGLPAGGPGLRRHRDRSHLHRRDRGPARRVVGRRAPGQAATAKDADHLGLPGHDRGPRRVPCHGGCHRYAERLGVRTGPLAHRPGARPDAHSICERRPIRVR